jgi:hypothetical protein
MRIAQMAATKLNTMMGHLSVDTDRVIEAAAYQSTPATALPLAESFGGPPGYLPDAEEHRTMFVQSCEGTQ